MTNYIAARVGEERREAIIQFIADYIKEHEYSPSVREIAHAVGVSSPAAQSHLMVLVREGRISMLPGASRTIRIVGN